MPTMQRNAAPVRISACDCVTPLGNSSATHAALLEGRTALCPTPVLGRQGGDPVPLALLPGRTLNDDTPPTWLKAMRDLLAPVKDDGWGRTRRPVCFASSNFGVGSLYEFHNGGSPEAMLYSTPELCVDWVRRELGWGQHYAIFSHACVSAHVALQHASRLVQSGAAESALVVSFDFLSPFVTGGFHALKILNGTSPAPYQARDIGAIGLGDGAAYAAVSRDRGNWEIAAQSLYNEMYHFTANQPEGSGFRCVLEPLAATNLKLWVKGHGTGTIEAGRLESQAVSSLFPDSPIVGWKGALGHTLGSCGLVELALAVEALQSGMTPGTVGSTAPTFTPQVSLGSFSNRGFDGVLCTSNAFGGAHAGLIVRHV